MGLQSAYHAARTALNLVTVLTAFGIAGQPIALGQAEGNAFQQPPEAPRPVDHELRLDLTVGYAYVPVFNPAISANNILRIRAYNGALVGPTIRVQPGDRLTINLTNALPAETMANDTGDMNVPHDFNVTNLHTHGLHVSPQGNSDNVFISVAPGSTFRYTFDIPKDHPSGTFFYHAHRHGSTALQVSSGMAGALIVEGTPNASADRHGHLEIDTLLDGLPDRIWLFQQIPYSCAGKLALTDCQADAIGEVEDYNGRFGPGAWEYSGHLTTVNGQAVPALHVKTGQIERWRLVHGGVRETLQVKIAACDPVVTPTSASAKFAATMGTIETRNETVSQWEIATDGLTRSDILERLVNVLQPGYRSDVLVRFSRPGVYCVIDEEDLSGPTTKSTVDAEAESRKLLAIVHADGPITKATSGTLLASELTLGHPHLPASALQNLRSLSIARFAGQNDLRNEPIDGKQALAFSVDVSKSPNVFQVDGHNYDPARIDRTLKLNHLDEWSLTSYFGSHPFHIHTNPFQIVSITTAKGKSITNATCLADDDGDPQYCGMIGSWRDTLFIKQDYKIVIRTRYLDFTGDFVLHCHILDHEDQGMMQNVRILP